MGMWINHVWASQVLTRLSTQVVFRLCDVDGSLYSCVERFEPYAQESNRKDYGLESDTERFSVSFPICSRGIEYFSHQ